MTTDQLLDMTEAEKLSFINQQLELPDNANLCKIADPTCISCE